MMECEPSKGVSLPFLEEATIMSTKSLCIVFVQDREEKAHPNYQFMQRMVEELHPVSQSISTCQGLFHILHGGCPKTLRNLLPSVLLDKIVQIRLASPWNVQGFRPEPLLNHWYETRF